MHVGMLAEGVGILSGCSLLSGVCGETLEGVGSLFEGCREAVWRV